MLELAGSPVTLCITTSLMALLRKELRERGTPSLLESHWYKFVGWRAAEPDYIGVWQKDHVCPSPAPKFIML